MDALSDRTSPDDDRDRDQSIAGEEGEGRKLSNSAFPLYRTTFLLSFTCHVGACVSLEKRFIIENTNPTPSCVVRTSATG